MLNQKKSFFDAFFDWEIGKVDVLWAKNNMNIERYIYIFLDGYAIDGSTKNSFNYV